MPSQLLPPYLTATTVTVTVDGVPATIVQTTLVTSVLPTQALPSYLSASTYTTDIGGVSTTGVSTVGVPLTYVGPSIPLGPDDVWTFAGSSSTISFATPISSTSISATPPLTPTPSSQTAIPSSQTATPSSQTATPSTLTSPISVGSGTPPPSSTSSQSPVVPVPSAKSSLGLTQRDGVILAAVVAGVVIISLINLLLWRCLRRRRRRYNRDGLGDFVIVDAEGQVRYAGEGVPRPNGEESDSFLRRGNANATNVMQEINRSPALIGRRNPPSHTDSDITTGTISPPEGVIPIAVSRTPDTPASPPFPGKTSPFFHASASSLFFHPARGADPSITRKGGDAQGRRGSMSMHDEFSVSASIGQNVTARSPAQLGSSWRQDSRESTASHGYLRGATELGLQRSSLLSGQHRGSALLSNHPSHPVSMRTSGSQPDTMGSDDERVTLLTARRVNMNEGGPSTLAYVERSGASPSSWSSSLGLGLGGLRRLSRLSWFQRLETVRSNSSDDQDEQNLRSPSPESVSPSHTPSPAPPPTSHATMSSSGETFYYDAPSSFSNRSESRADNGDSAGGRSGSTNVPPRATTAMDLNTTSHGRPQTPVMVQHNTGSDIASADQPALLLLSTPSELPTPHSSPPGGSLGTTTTTTRVGTAEADFNPQTQEPFDIDILDTPAPLPAAVSPFSTSSSRGGGAGQPVLPPGLDLAHVHAWRESSSDMPSSATFGEGSGIEIELDACTGTADDTLEDAPPLPRTRWTLLRSVTTSNAASSTRSYMQLGVPSGLDDHSSHVGSLHSIPNIPSERLSPYSTMNSQPGSSLGSASGSGSRSRSAQHSHSPAGSHSRNSGGSRSDSNSQRSHSRSRPQSRGAMSVTSDGLLRVHREGSLGPLTPRSVASSAGSSVYQRPRLSAFGSSRTPTSPQRSPAADAAFAAALSGKVPEGAGTVLGRRM